MSYVLLVEDEDFNQAVVGDIFEFDAPETELVCVESGEDAIQQANERTPALILMDIGLPGIDGIEATRRLKASPVTQAVPVWALTAHAMKGDEQKALSAGCDAYVTKPIDTKDFVGRLTEFLNQTETCEK